MINEMSFSFVFISIKYKEKLVSWGDGYVKAWYKGVIFMRIQGDMEALTENEALKLITSKLGFPKPSPQYLCWYFYKDDDGLYTPRVNFDSLATEIKQENFVERLANVISLSQHHPDKKTVFMQIRLTIKNHEI